MLRILVCGVGLPLFGCMSNVVKDDYVKNHAATDMECPAEEITVSRSGNTDWTAQGCGKTEQYVCWTS